jgi:hypothetical protein
VGQKRSANLLGHFYSEVSLNQKVKFAGFYDSACSSQIRTLVLDAYSQSQRDRDLGDECKHREDR